MSDAENSTSDDEVFDELKDLIGKKMPGWEIAPPEAIDEFLTQGAIAHAEADEQAISEGRRFLNEETDGEIIEMWWKDAQGCNSIEEACAFATRLLRDYRHDYGTICHALAAGTLAMAWGMNREPEGHITGFQSGFVMWGFVKRWMSIDGPVRLTQYDQLLYPQYDHQWQSISEETMESLQKIAQKQLEEFSGSDVVRERLELVASGKLPEFMRVSEP